MNFKNEKFELEFSIKDKPTVRDQLAYYSEAGLARGGQLFERYWLGARQLIVEWACPKMPDYMLDLDTISDPSITELIIWAGMQVKRHRDSLDEIPKN